MVLMVRGSFTMTDRGRLAAVSLCHGRQRQQRGAQGNDQRTGDQSSHD
jgi:hypothetical protein